MAARTPRLLVAAGALGLSALLAACGEPPPTDQGLAPRADAGAPRSSLAARDAAQESRMAAQEARTGATLPRSRMPEAAGSVASGLPVMDSRSSGTAVMGGSAAPAERRMDDAQITARVAAGLAATRDIGDTRIDVDTRDGVVTLSGAVRSAGAKARADEVARGVREVRSVNNQLTVATS